LEEPTSFEPTLEEPTLEEPTLEEPRSRFPLIGRKMAPVELPSEEKVSGLRLPPVTRQEELLEPEEVGKPEIFSAETEEIFEIPKLPSVSISVEKKLEPKFPRVSLQPTAVPKISQGLKSPIRLPQPIPKTPSAEISSPVINISIGEIINAPSGKSKAEEKAEKELKEKAEKELKAEEKALKKELKAKEKELKEKESKVGETIAPKLNLEGLKVSRPLNVEPKLPIPPIFQPVSQMIPGTDITPAQPSQDIEKVLETPQRQFRSPGPRPVPESPFPTPLVKETSAPVLPTLGPTLIPTLTPEMSAEVVELRKKVGDLETQLKEFRNIFTAFNQRMYMIYPVNLPDEIRTEGKLVKPIPYSEVQKMYNNNEIVGMKLDPLIQAYAGSYRSNNRYITFCHRNGTFYVSRASYIPEDKKNGRAQQIGPPSSD